MRIEDIAHVCHEANRVLQVIQNDPAVSPPWQDAPDWQRASAIEGVQHAIDGATPEELHEEWVNAKIRDGWGYGEVKDAEAKMHPCICDYDALPDEQRAKDDLFHGIVRALAGA